MCRYVQNVVTKGLMESEVLIAAVSANGSCTETNSTMEVECLSSDTDTVELVTDSETTMW
jgi:hypothetical protein